ncbi:TIGR02186 family protein [Rhodovulum sp. YNF3179]|uniref:TIGR02186 family protein n=1 Tax=Rhodovulum sp. YNF3179 TaxID=3425127 RepID=UPI003D350EE9
MRRLLLSLALLAAATTQAPAEEVVAGLSQNRVSITANFDGSEIMIFGAVKRTAPPPDAGPLEVVVKITGPLTPVVVRRKERVLGVWANTAAVEVDAAPSFYAVATTGPLREILSDTEDLRHRISIERMIRSVGAPMDITDSQAFSEAIVRIRADKGLYRTYEGAVELTEETLFRTAIGLPANLVEGDYTARIFLIRDRGVVDMRSVSIEVSKVGLERWIYDLAHQRPLAYGMLSLVIAIAAGWIASAVFGRFRT